MEGKIKRNNLQFTKQIPKFLQSYSHLLTINKKNYMNEELGKVSSDEDEPEPPTKLEATNEKKQIESQ